MGGRSEQVDDRPAWARRLRAERSARGWSQADAVRIMRTQSSRPLAGDASLLRSWKRWEAGDVEPDDVHKKLIAQAFGTVTAAFFPTPGRRDSDIVAGTGMTTVEILSRIRASDVSASTLDAVRITADRLCGEYPYASSDHLQVEARTWLRRITHLFDARMSLMQHRELLSLAGLVALLVGCLEHDMGRRRDAEVTRRAALSLGEEADDADVTGWAYEMRAWYALTRGDYPAAIAAAQAGEAVATHRSVAVQLAAQQAKAWARIGDHRQMALALDRGRTVLERLPPPEDPDHHFVVDPAKFDFYAMDCYRVAGADRLAEMYAEEVIRTSTEVDGTPRKPMRIAEAQVTLAVVAARHGDLERAVAQGREAMHGARRSVPSLVLCSQELGRILRDRYPRESETAAYLDELHTLAGA